MYALMYLLWSGMVLYGLSFGIVSLVIRILALVGIATIATRSLNLPTRMDILPYAISWAIIAAVMDGIFLVPFSGWALYSEWSVLAGYLLVAIAPLATFSLRFRPVRVS